MQRAMRFDEAVLRQIIGQSMIPANPAQKGPHHTLMGADQSFKIQFPLDGITLGIRIGLLAPDKDPEAEIGQPDQ